MSSKMCDIRRANLRDLCQDLSCRLASDRRSSRAIPVCLGWLAHPIHLEEIGMSKSSCASLLK